MAISSRKYRTFFFQEKHDMCEINCSRKRKKKNWMIRFAFLTILVSVFASPAERSEQLIASWKSPTCQHFHRPDYFAAFEHISNCNSSAILSCPPRGMIPRIRHYPDPSVLRWHCTPSPRVGRSQSIRISFQHKFIYVENLKVASSTIRFELKKEFNVFVGWDPSQQILSEMIPDDFAKEFFVFTFVRHPLSKLESGLAQAQKMRRDNNISVSVVLDGYAKGCIYDPHVHSQVYNLAVNTQGRIALEYDFMGTLEHFSEDWAYLLRILRTPPSQRNLALFRSMRSSIPSEFNTTEMPQRNRRGLNATLPDYANATESSNVCKIIMQDAVCLGYEVPSFCRP